VTWFLRNWDQVAIALGQHVTIVFTALVIAFAIALPAPMRLSAKLASMAVTQPTANPLTPPPCSRKNATTGNAMKNSPALRLLAGSRGINSGSKSAAASAKVRLTRQRSASG